LLNGLLSSCVEQSIFNNEAPSTRPAGRGASHAVRLLAIAKVDAVISDPDGRPSITGRTCLERQKRKLIAGPETD